MIRSYKHGHIASFVEEKKRHRSARLWLAAGAFMIVSAALLIYHHTQFQSREYEIRSGSVKGEIVSEVIWQPQRLSVQDRRAVIQRAERSLPEALGQWKAALGGWLPIQAPQLLFDEPCSRSPGELACAKIGNPPVIVFSAPSASIQRPRTMRLVLLHEIGHLLGVPHIDGDCTMDPNLQQFSCDDPSPAAVALAKLSRERRAAPIASAPDLQIVPIQK